MKVLLYHEYFDGQRIYDKRLFHFIGISKALTLHTHPIKIDKTTIISYLLLFGLNSSLISTFFYFILKSKWFLKRLDMLQE